MAAFIAVTIQTRQSCEFVIHIESNTEMVAAGEVMTVENMKERGKR